MSVERCEDKGDVKGKRKESRCKNFVGILNCERLYDVLN